MGRKRIDPDEKKVPLGVSIRKKYVDLVRKEDNTTKFVKAQVASANGVMPEMSKHMREQQRIQREVR
ncbi:hypothetical protein ACQVUL_20645 [Bacillus cytotoxicus]|uniref:Uncharacterized protein n=1 Tax=Bacillus cytotoxicus (strain DSM 22905 / CIP 110041 / 391-98 / NVH 391-98) TaxID=315749 RepID=A7GVR1_BACCN|nr:hypothetical protein [Bacillus cytotoxicus]ABS24219.1 hypothetical protein Bcer98_4038 [Bacillus cytotoxicus NVH 391-98]